MSLLIDADLIVYRVACTCEDEVEQVAKWRIDDTIRDIYEATEAKEAIFALTGRDNFRKQLDPTYKANRTQERPKFWQACRDYLASKYKAIVIDHYEADDYLGWSQTPNTVVVSLDKDLLMIPGKHYNWVRKEWTTVTEDSANQTFYRQLLIGDTSDNVFGIKGVGPKKAEKALSELSTVEELFDKVRSMYDDDKRFLLNCNLLWIMRKEGEMWQDRFPEMAGVLFSSTEEGVEP
jgi:DNA polymerase-1